MMSNYNPFSLEGKTILVTGASSGIGKATAIECSKLGAKVIATARNKERLEETMSELSGEGHKMFLCDLTDSKAMEEMVSQLPVIQGLVNNAGIGEMLPVNFIREEKLKNILQTNTISPIMLLKILLKGKRISNNSSIVFMSSISGLGYASLGTSMYATSKGAISTFVAGAAYELANKNIRVNAVCPGMVETKLIEPNTLTMEQLDENRAMYPLKRYGQPNEIAWAVIYLLSNASNWVTGINLVIDGGITLI